MSIAFCLSLSPSLSFLSSLVLADRLSTTICEHYDFQTWFLRFAAIERRCTRCVWVLCSNLWVFIQCALPEIEYKRRNRKKTRAHTFKGSSLIQTHTLSRLYCFISPFDLYGFGVSPSLRCASYIRLYVLPVSGIHFSCSPLQTRCEQCTWNPSAFCPISISTRDDVRFWFKVKKK